MSSRDTTAQRAPGAPVVLLGLLFLVALLGRFSFGRFGDGGLADVDLRLVGALTLLAVTFLWATNGAGRAHLPQARYLQLTFLFFGYQAASATWAPEQARAGAVFVDVAVLAALLLVVVLLAEPGPEHACTVVLALLGAVGVVYALAGLFLSSPDAQGRISAFGGGPNVYVRVVGLGLIAVLVLGLSRRAWPVLLPVPLLIAAMVLSGSRGGITAAIVTAVAAAWWLRRWLSVRRVVPVLLGAVACLAVVDVTMGDRLRPLLQSRFDLDTLTENGFSTRPELLDRAIDVFGDHPLAGAGLDGFHAESGRFIGMTYPHNYVAQVAAEGGAVGLLLLALAVGAVLWGLGPLGRLTPAAFGCSLGALFVAVASMSSGDYYDSRFAWILGALAVCAGTRASSPALRQPQPAAVPGA